ncbi:hypothetical protein T484DRAFT_1851768, partial [Baffinella frigidus]
MIRLWLHECERVFADRMITEALHECERVFADRMIAEAEKLLARPNMFTTF